MVRQATNRTAAAGFLFATAAAWPIVSCLVAELSATPLERALRAGWCGSAPSQFEVIGHCPACWIGAATFALAGVLILARNGVGLGQFRGQLTG